MSEKRKYDSTVARIAGNIAGNMLDRVLVVQTRDGARYPTDTLALIATDSVALARLIVAQVERTEPQPVSPPSEYCTCRPVDGDYFAINGTCPIHATRGNIERSYTLPQAGNTR